MALKVSVFIATSLDGYIARKNGALDWLPGSAGEPGGEDYGFADFFGTIATVVLGRVTCQVASAFTDWPYTGKQVVVLSHRYPQTLKPLAQDLRLQHLSTNKL